MHPGTGLTHFRAKIGTVGIGLIGKIVTSATQGKAFQRGGRLILDTTRVPLDILYPADIRILEHCRQQVLPLVQ
jgi:hypothetical protein